MANHSHSLHPVIKTHYNYEPLHALSAQKSKFETHLILTNFPQQNASLEKTRLLSETKRFELNALKRGVTRLPLSTLVPFHLLPVSYISHLLSSTKSTLGSFQKHYLKIKNSLCDFSSCCAPFTELTSSPSKSSCFLAPVSLLHPCSFLYQSMFLLSFFAKPIFTSLKRTYTNLHSITS